MAAITIVQIQKTEQHPGQVGYREWRGVGAFNSTDATGTLASTPFTLIDNIQLNWAGAPAADENIYAPAPSTDGLTRPSSGSITIGRTGASKTSGLKFHFRITGR